MIQQAATERLTGYAKDAGVPLEQVAMLLETGKSVAEVTAVLMLQIQTAQLEWGASTD